MGEEVRQHRDGRHRDGRGQRKLPVDGGEHDRRADEHEGALDRLHDAPPDEIAHRVDVVRRARDDLAGCVAVVEGARIAQVRVVQLRAQTRLDGDPDPRRGIAPGEVDDEPDRCDREDRDEVRHEQRMVVPVDRVVDRPLHEDRDREREHGEDNRARETDRDQPPLGPPERVEVPDRRPECEVGRVDVRHGCSPRTGGQGCRAEPRGHGAERRPRARAPRPGAVKRRRCR